MSCADPITIRRPASWALSIIATGLSSVTVVSVGMAMFALVDDKRLAGLFAAAAVLLDVFKYRAWPFAAAQWAARRTLCAWMLVACAVVLAGVSCWATYDRMMGSIVGSRALQQAIQQQRIADLEAARAGDGRLLVALDAEAASVHAQAFSLRGRGMVSKAAELEASALPRIAAQRDQARDRLDRQSQELTALRATPAKGAGLPVELATLLCLGFALALEIVPALILTALRRPVSSGKTAEVAAVDSEAAAIAPETLEQPAETQQVAEETPAVQLVGADAERGDNAELLRKLLEETAETPPGSLVTLREFAKSHSIRPMRAVQVFRLAVRAGRLAKEGNRYRICGSSLISGCAN